MLSGLVFDIKKFSLHDGPGIRTTVFLKGCPLTCSWCHNPESQFPGPEVFYFRDRCLLCEGCLESCPHQATSLGPEGILTDPLKCRGCGICADSCPSEARQVVGREMSVDDVMAEIEKDQLFYEESRGGVTFSGGEPLTQPRFLIELLKRCGKLGLHRTVDTCGQAANSVLRDVARHTDLFLFDIKHMDSERHREHTGVGNERILSNLQWLAESGAKVKIRVPLVPGVNDDAENIARTAAFVSALPGLQEIHLLPFHKAAGDKHRRFGMPYQFDESRETPPERLPLIKRLLEDHGLTVRVGG